MVSRITSKTAITFLFVAGIIGFLMMTSGCEIKSSVAGYVFLNDKPMANWEVQLIDANGAVARSEKTNAQGHFIISDVSPGDYTVRVLNFSGMPHPDDRIPAITVRPGRTEIFDIKLGTPGGAPELKPPGR